MAFLDRRDRAQRGRVAAQIADRLQQGIEPAPVRRRQYSWATFIKAHLGAIAAADFFTVEALSWAGLVRYHVFS